MRRRGLLAPTLAVLLALFFFVPVSDTLAQEEKNAPEEKTPSKEAAPEKEKPTEEKPAREAPDKEVPPKETPDKKPAEDKPAKEAPEKEKPTEEKPAEEKPAEEKPAEDAPAPDRTTVEEETVEEAPEREESESPGSESPGSESPGSESPGSGPPEIEARAWALVDGESGRYLAGENADQRRQVASLTKLMAALVVLDEGTDLEEKVRVSAEAEEYVGDVYSNVGLIEGERLTVRDLLTATLLASGFDAVYALAEYEGNGDPGAFVRRMNEKAEGLGLANTRFDNPAGQDSRENYSSAADIAVVAREVMGNETFAEIVGQEAATLSTTRPGANRRFEIYNTNALLKTYPAATGMKTGTTPEAGPSLAASAAEDGESYVAVVLDAGAEDEESGDRYSDAIALLDYGFDNYEREVLIPRDEVYGEIEVPFRDGEKVELAAADEVTGLVGPDAGVERRVTDPEEPPPSVEANQELGEVEVLVDGESAGRSPLVARAGYEEANLFQKLWYRGQDLLNG